LSSKMDITGFLKKISEFIPKRDIARLVFKILLGVWAFVLVTVIALQTFSAARDDIEKRMTRIASGTKYRVSDKAVGTERYEHALRLTKQPEKPESYTGHITRDPFSEYRGIAVAAPELPEYDFELKAVAQVPLPMAYRGYIELPDKIIGQVNWRNETKFVNAGSALNGYKIISISREKISAVDSKGVETEFFLNKPIFGDELEAVLYDRISKKTFSAQRSDAIGEYKVIDIGTNYVILDLKGEEIRLGR